MKHFILFVRRRFDWCDILMTRSDTLKYFCIISLLMNDSNFNCCFYFNRFVLESIIIILCNVVFAHIDGLTALLILNSIWNSRWIFVPLCKHRKDRNGWPHCSFLLVLQASHQMLHKSKELSFKVEFKLGFTKDPAFIQTRPWSRHIRTKILKLTRFIRIIFLVSIFLGTVHLSGRFSSVHLWSKIFQLEFEETIAVLNF